MKNKSKLVSFFLRWEFLLVALLVLMCIVFNLQDAARVASGAARKDVFNLPNVMRGLRPYMLYSFMTMGVMLIYWPWATSTSPPAPSPR